MDLEEKLFKTRIGDEVKLNANPFPWARDDFAYLGVIRMSGGHVIGWAWHKDGRSIDALDRGFDLIDFGASDGS